MTGAFVSIMQKDGECPRPPDSSAAQWPLPG